MDERSSGCSVEGLHVVVHRPAMDQAIRVVLVHGVMDRASSFAKVARRLADLEVVRYDRRGYGRSHALTGGRFGVHVDDLLEIVGDRPSVLAGHSLGGTIALAAAARRASAAQAVLVYEPPLPWASPHERAPRAIDDGSTPEDVAETFMRGIIGDRRWERLPLHTRRERRQEGPALLADLAEMWEGRALFDLDAVECPILVAWGSRATPRHRAGARFLLEQGRHVTSVVVEGADHDVHLRHPEQFAGLVRRAAALA